MIIELIDKLYESGELLALIQSGFISPQVLLYRKVFHLYNDRIELGRTKTEAVDDVCFTFEYSQRSVYYILKFMRQEYTLPEKC
jgi:hypothetical protein